MWFDWLKKELATWKRAVRDPRHDQARGGAGDPPGTEGRTVIVPQVPLPIAVQCLTGLWWRSGSRPVGRLEERRADLRRPGLVVNLG